MGEPDDAKRNGAAPARPRIGPTEKPRPPGGRLLSTERDDERGGCPFELGAFDLDGTVLRRDLEITERTVAAMDVLRERGVRLVVATGRRYESAREQAERLGFGGEDPLICYGGSMVRRMNGETLLHHTLPRDAAVEALEWAADRGLHARIFADGRIVTAPDTSAALEHLRRIDGPGVSTVDSPADWLRDGRSPEPTKIALADHPSDVSGWLEEARAAFAGRLYVTRSLPHYVELVDPEGIKSKALAFLCGRWGIDPNRVIAFGDADNDVDMLRFAGRGVAVGGMNEEVRRAADAVAPGVEEDGVARYIEGLLRRCWTTSSPTL